MVSGAAAAVGARFARGGAAITDGSAAATRSAGLGGRFGSATDPWAAVRAPPPGTDGEREDREGGALEVDGRGVATRAGAARGVDGRDVEGRLAAVREVDVRGVDGREDDARGVDVRELVARGVDVRELDGRVVEVRETDRGPADRAPRAGVPPRDGVRAVAGFDGPAAAFCARPWAVDAPERGLEARAGPRGSDTGVRGDPEGARFAVATLDVGRWGRAPAPLAGFEPAGRDPAARVRAAPGAGFDAGALGDVEPRAATWAAEGRAAGEAAPREREEAGFSDTARRDPAAAPDFGVETAGVTRGLCRDAAAGFFAVLEAAPVLVAISSSSDPEPGSGARGRRHTPQSTNGPVPARLAPWAEAASTPGVTRAGPAPRRAAGATERPHSRPARGPPHRERRGARPGRGGPDPGVQPAGPVRHSRTSPCRGPRGRARGRARERRAARAAPPAGDRRGPGRGGGDRKSVV